MTCNCEYPAIAASLFHGMAEGKIRGLAGMFRPNLLFFSHQLPVTSYQLRVTPGGGFAQLGLTVGVEAV
jgi:hypothetical protein